MFGGICEKIKKSNISMNIIIISITNEINQLI